eukprot:2534852-Heterocapsa_arctica.AAC.1
MVIARALPAGLETPKTPNYNFDRKIAKRRKRIAKRRRRIAKRRKRRLLLTFRVLNLDYGKLFG